jgi:hypothetical protein
MNSVPSYIVRKGHNWAFLTLLTTAVFTSTISCQRLHVAFILGPYTAFGGEKLTALIVNDINTKQICFLLTVN